MIDINKRLGYLISDRVELEWIKISMFNSETKYEHFPALYLRFKPCNEAKENYRINTVLTNFRGINKWTLEKYPMSKNNLFSLTINEFHKYNRALLENNGKYFSPSEFFGDIVFKSLCKTAIYDIEPLCDWVDCNLNKS